MGKELLAQHLHRLSPRSSKAFVDLNCAAVPATLLESELFGHERGAFTGAGDEKPGLVEVADGGTLFLDEVGEMAPEMQAKLLRVLDSGTFYRVGRHPQAARRLPAGGGHEPRPRGPRSQAGRFRKDLFYRIHGVHGGDPAAARAPRGHAAAGGALRAPAAAWRKRFSPAALAALAAHDWPGNVRELHFAVERAGLLAEGDVIDVGDLPPEILERSVQRPATGLGGMAAAGGHSPSRSASAPHPPAARPQAPPSTTTTRRRTTWPSAGAGPTPRACARPSRRAAGVGSRPPRSWASRLGPCTVG